MKTLILALLCACTGCCWAALATESSWRRNGNCTTGFIDAATAMQTRPIVIECFRISDCSQCRQAQDSRANHAGPCVPIVQTGGAVCEPSGFVQSRGIQIDTECGQETCFDIQECLTMQHNCDATGGRCSNTVGSFQCSCISGYTGDGVACTNVDECAIGNHNCNPQATCTDTPGSFTCACNAGYTDWGHLVRPIINGIHCFEDECVTGSHNCDPNAGCTDTLDSFVCLCNAGYLGDGTGLSCSDFDECEAIPRFPAATHWRVTNLGDADGRPGVRPVAFWRNPDETNLLLAQDTYAEIISSENDGPGWMYEPVRAFERFQDDSTTPWWAGHAAPRAGEVWIGVRYATPEIIRRARADGLGVGTQIFPFGGPSWNGGLELQYSNDGVVWSRAASMPNSNVVQVLVEPVNLSSANCHGVALCNNTDGSFTCMCSEGFHTFDEAVTCLDSNECALNTHDCNANAWCNNTYGSFECTCNSGFYGDGVNCTEIDECRLGLDDCSPNALCTNLPGLNYSCTCNDGFQGDGVVCIGLSCREEAVYHCHALAYCENDQCFCSEGAVGDGYWKAMQGTECSRESWSIQVSLDLTQTRTPRRLLWVDPTMLTPDGKRLRYWERDRSAFGDLFFEDAATKPTWFDGAMFHFVTERCYLTVHALFFTEAEAQLAISVFQNRTYSNTPVRVFETGMPWVFDVNTGTPSRPGVPVTTLSLTTDPRISRFVAPTAEAEQRVAPTGMDVVSVFYDSKTSDSGCWVIELIYTTGEDNFNVFYIPKAVGNESLSYNFDYSIVPDYAVSYGKSPADTFLPLNFPCGSDGYNYNGNPGFDIPDRVSACCIEEFTRMYRPVDSFLNDPEVVDVLGASRGNFCSTNATRKMWNITYRPESALFGNFSGMGELARVEFKSVENPFIHQYAATVYLDEVALRTKAGLLTGSVGVAHSVDTFIGFANFRPTGLEFLDMFAAQTSIHLETTNFFTVAAYGTNQFTFLEYVNLRLVAIYKEDNARAPSTGAVPDSFRTNSTDAAHYLQLTFTFGAQYQPIETGIIPIDSVLVSKGEHISSSSTLDTRFHACRQYLDGSFHKKTLFDSRFPADSGTTQTCAPNATMCHNPPHIPDQFVHFNIPLGIDWLPTPSNVFDSKVFVELVVSVIDTKQIAVPNSFPNTGDRAEQMKTTITASIAVVEGGMYIFCDKLTVRADLLDVANADLILGSAGLEHEFSRLRILTDIASEPFNNNRRNDTYIKTTSIESGLMTLVLKGNESYFARAGFALVLEDVFTMHIMEPETGTKYDQVLALLSSPGTDLLSDESVALNGAFALTVDRAQSRAMLQPTDALAQLCPFSPQRPNPNDAFPETCVSRRDVQHRGFPSPLGNATAIELPAATVPLDDAEREGVAKFMQLVLNPSQYSAQLGRNFSHLVGQKYELNGRYRRAFWINPGYEWTPAQTGGQQIFTLSQKLIMVALTSFVEGSLSRRMLMQSATPVQSDGAVSAQDIIFDTTPQSMMANFFSIPEELVAMFSVQMQLTHQQACSSVSDLRRSLRATLDEFVSATSTQFETVQITSMVLDVGDVQCSSRRLLSRQLATSPSATVSLEMMVVFSPASSVAINVYRFANMESVNSIEPVAVSNRIQILTVDDEFVLPTPKQSTPMAPDTPSAIARDEAADGKPQKQTSRALDEGVLVVVATACVVVLVIAVYFSYRKLLKPREATVISFIDVNDGLKAELALPPVDRRCLDSGTYSF